MTTLLAMTQDEALAAIRDQVGNGASDDTTAYLYLTLALTALALAILLLVIKHRRSQRTAAKPTPTLHNPKKLLKEIRRETHLTRADLKSLHRAATHLSKHKNIPTPSPLTIALCPSLQKKSPAPVTRASRPRAASL